MSRPLAALRTLAFADLERGMWGAAWMPAQDRAAVTTLGANGGGAVVSGLRLSADADAGEWDLSGERTALIVSPAGEGVSVGATDDRVEGFDQLCRVTGRFELDGAEHAVDCLGLRASRSGTFDLSKLESVRAVSSWFEPDVGLSVMAFRARKAKAHDGDVLTAAVLNPEASARVEDPRLSTTYDGAGWPIRAGVELWIAGEGEDEQYPRRASGEAAGGRAQSADGELEVRAEPFRWHSHGREGAGMYILARRR